MKRYDRDNDVSIALLAHGDEVELILNGESTLVSREKFEAGAEGAVAAWIHRHGLPPMNGFADFWVERVTVRVGEREWASIPWEALLARRTVVRVSAVRPRVAQIPLAFPLRFLEAGGGISQVHDFLENLLGETERREFAVVDAFVDPAEVEGFVAKSAWPTVDVLDLRDCGGLPRWLNRLTERCQTRLVLLQVSSDQLMSAREAAQALVDRGGPAVWLFAAPPNRVAIYESLIHDRPLDYIRAAVADGELFAGAGREELLRYSRIADALKNDEKRESVTLNLPARKFRAMVAKAVEVVVPVATALPEIPAAAVIVKSLNAFRRKSRVSTVKEAIAGSLKTTRIVSDDLAFEVPYDPLKLDRLSANISTSLLAKGLVAPAVHDVVTGHTPAGPRIEIETLARRIATTVKPIGAVTGPAAARLLSDKLGRIAAVSYKYEDHESEGLLPLASRVKEIQALLGVFRGKTPHEAKPARAVNAAFFAEKTDGDLRKIAQAHARLTPSKLVHLGIKIGRENELSVTLGDTTIVEELVRAPEGTWLEVGVTAIDFDLEGDPVQPLFLPADGSSDLITFAMRPRSDGAVAGTARLRFSIFRDNNLVQSFLMAAALETIPGSAALHEALAKSLKTTPAEVRRVHDAGYLMRLEYSAAPVTKFGDVAPRALSIVANDVAGQKVVTIKGEDLFTVSVDANLIDHVKTARKALDEASEDGAKLYRYTFDPREPNSGDPAELGGVAWNIASGGWKIYNSLVRSERNRQAVRQRVEMGGGIHAAHIDASTTIPWSLIYDRPVYDPGEAVVGNTKFTHAFCRASMPDAAGVMPDVQCGGRGCLLHPDENEQRRKSGDPLLSEETVICPRRFWGFMFPIEVPAQQVDGIAGREPPQIEDNIKAGRPANIIVATNPNLSQEGTHVADLQARVGSRAVLHKSPAGAPAVREFLNTTAGDLDILYFYCHALASLQKKGPCLDFGHGFDQSVVTDVLEAADFSGKEWDHAPLVFMNGCGNVGFSPYAPAEFIKQFIQGRYASAVIGTEVAVVEELAMDVANRFLESFLAGANAGDALLAARRSLLSRNNPLGLIYTLFGSARLELGKHDRP